MANLKVHGSVFSTNTMRAVAALYEKGLEFNFIPVDLNSGEHKKEPFLSLNPFGQVPALEDGNLKLFESRAITQYVAHAYADKGTPLVSGEPKKLGSIGVWSEVEAHQFDPAASKLTWEHVVKPMFGMATDGGVVAEQEVKLGKVLDVYEARLGVSKYLASDCFSLADLNHLPNIQYLMGTSSKKLFESRPRVSAWCSDILARPAWSKVLTLQKS